MHEEFRALAVPVDAPTDRTSHEVLRVWTGETEYVSLTDRLYTDPATWGHLLCQVARHVANSYQLNGFAEREQVLADIRRQFLESFDDRRTDNSTGRLTD